MRKYRFCYAMFLFVVAAALNVTSQTRINLWNNKAPGANGTGTADVPWIEIYKPNASVANGSAILVVPGGAYGMVVMSEAQAARNYWLPKGFVVVVLSYRVAPYKYPIPMWDVKRAMRLVRSKAEEWNVDQKRIGVLGCSAGGHLASYLATHYDMGDPQASDPIDRLHCRPDFSIFVYPVITMDASFTHSQSRSNIIGNNPSAALVDSLSNEKQVTADTPPTFLVHGTVDNVVQVRNSQVFYDACVQRGVKAKFYKMTLSCGGHGFGYSCGNWGDTCYQWLKSSGCLDATTSVRDAHRVSSIPANSGTDDYVLLDISGKILGAGKNSGISGNSTLKLKHNTTGTFILAKKIAGRYYPVGRKVLQH